MKAAAFLTAFLLATAIPAVDAVAATCCRVCTAGIPCGNGCIKKTRQCMKPKGCACSAAGKKAPRKKASAKPESPEFLGLLGEQKPLLRATVTGVTDGDTFSVLVAGWPEPLNAARVRLLAVDTPELNHAQCPAEKAKAEKARDFVAKLLPVGSVVKLALGSKATDSFGRYLASVTLASGRDMGTVLVAKGMAAPYDGQTKPDWCL